MAAIVGDGGAVLANAAWRSRIDPAAGMEFHRPSDQPAGEVEAMLYVAFAGIVRRNQPSPQRIRLRDSLPENTCHEIVLSTLLGPDGEIDGVLATAIDISGEIRAEEDERARQQEFGFQMRSMLAVVRSIVGHGAETRQPLEEFSSHLSDRIDALARIQAKLMRGAGDVDLEELVVDQVAAQAGGRPFDVEGPAIRLPAQVTGALGLALHELATNALKFGALSKDTGSLAITWRIENPHTPLLRMVWIERGVSVISAAPREWGFGLRFIEEAIAYELQGEVVHELSPGGLRCELRVPLHGVR